MKKFLLFFVLLFSSYLIVSAETTDITGPKLNSFSLGVSELKAGENLPLNINLIDDVAGTKSAKIVFVNPNNSKQFEVDYNVTDGDNSVNGLVSPTAVEGDYVIWYIYTYDNNNNKACYHGYKLFLLESGCESIEPVPLKISTGEYHRPKISSYKRTYGENNTVTHEMTFNNTEVIKSVRFFYGKYGWVNLYNQNGVFKSGNNTFRPGTYNLDYVEITTTENILFTYYHNDYPMNFSPTDTYVKYFDQKDTVIVIEGEEDLEAPKLVSFKLKSKEVTVPGFVDIEIKTKDNIPNNIHYVNVEYGEYKDEYHRAGGTMVYCPGHDDIYTCRIELNQYSKIGKYLVYAVHMADKSGHRSIYGSVSSGTEDYVELSGAIVNYELLGEYTFDALNDIKSDVTTSTNSSELYDKIEQVEDEGSISIDSTNNSVVDKKVFESIMGKDKTIYIETNGVVWIFNGKDITDPKQIDTKVDIQLMSYLKENPHDNRHRQKVKRALLINFMDNGNLPGKAKIRIKADYTFREYIGIKKLFVYYDNGEDYDLISKNINITKDGYYEFYINHNSTYILTNEEINESFVNNDLSNQLSNDVLSEENNVAFEENEEEIINNYDVEITKEEKETTKEITTKKDKTVYYIISGVALLVIVSLTLFLIYKRKRKKSK